MYTSQYMQAKDITKPAILISQDATLREAVERMNKEHTNTLLVTGENGVLVGEISVTDLLDAVIPDHLGGDDVLEHFTDENNFVAAVKAASDRPVSEFMVQDFTTVSSDDALITIVGNAIGFQRARIPVVDKDDRPIGIISRQGLKQILARFLQE